MPLTPTDFTKAPCTSFQCVPFQCSNEAPYLHCRLRRPRHSMTTGQHSIRSDPRQRRSRTGRLAAGRPLDERRGRPSRHHDNPRPKADRFPALPPWWTDSCRRPERARSTPLQPQLWTGFRRISRPPTASMSPEYCEPKQGVLPLRMNVATGMPGGPVVLLYERTSAVVSDRRQRAGRGQSQPPKAGLFVRNSINFDVIPTSPVPMLEERPRVDAVIVGAIAHGPHVFRRDPTTALKTPFHPKSPMSPELTYFHDVPFQCSIMA